MSNRILNHIQDKENEMKSSGIKRKALMNDENARVLSTKDSINKPQQSQLQSQQQQRGFASRRIPLGGKNHNSNSLTLNRSQSSLNSKIPVQPFNNTRPPSLTKSNSSLGFTAPLQQLKEQQQQQPTIHQEEQPPAKKISLDSLKDEIELGQNSSMPGSFSDSLNKNISPELSPIGNLESTITSNTAKLHVSYVTNDDVNRNHVDPMKRKSRLQNIENLVESHWQDPIETIPKKSVDNKYDLDPLSESELQFFSTPNDSFELNGNDKVFEQAEKSFELDFGGEEEEEDTNTANIAIIHDADEEIGLTNEDLNNLLG